LAGHRACSTRWGRRELCDRYRRFETGDEFTEARCVDGGSGLRGIAGGPARAGSSTDWCDEPPPHPGHANERSVLRQFSIRSKHPSVDANTVARLAAGDDVALEPTKVQLAVERYAVRSAPVRRISRSPAKPAIGYRLRSLRRGRLSPGHPHSGIEPPRGGECPLVADWKLTRLHRPWGRVRTPSGPVEFIVDAVVPVPVLGARDHSVHGFGRVTTPELSAVTPT